MDRFYEVWEKIMATFEKVVTIILSLLGLNDKTDD